jgi:hypothetical protein
MARFHPDGNSGQLSHIRYSPYVQPIMYEGVRSVRVDARIHEIEPLAFHFLLSFTKENNLRVIPTSEMLPSSGNPPA